MERLIADYGYLALFIGTFLEGETILVLAAFMAYRGYLRLEWVMFWGGFGSLTGDQLFYFIGRLKGQPFIERHARWRGRAARVRRALSRYPYLIILGFRFLYGIRTVTPFVIGASGFPPRRFAPLNVFGAALWAVAVSLGGFVFGQALEAGLRDLRRFEGAVLVLIVVAGVAAWLWRRTKAPTDELDPGVVAPAPPDQLTSERSRA